MKTATLVRHLDDWDHDSALYELDPPVLINGDEISHVVVSSMVPVDGHHGTLVLAATAAGDVTSWSRIAGTDSPDHAAALRLIGYQVAA